MSKIIFVNPPIAMEERYGRYAAAGSYFPPLQLASLASVARNHGFETGIIDPVALKWDFKTTVKSILNENPDYIGITATTVNIHKAGRLAGLIKRRRPDIKIIIGGVHLSAVPAETMKRFPDFDIGIIGEGEVTIIELLNAMDEKACLDKIKGLIFRRSDEIVQTDPRPLLRDLDSLPFPAWDLLPELARFYRPSLQSVRRLPSTMFMTTRGCFGRCIFCDRTIFGNKIRAHSTDYVMEIIKHLYTKYGIRDFQINDDSFLSYPSRVKNLCRRIRDENLKISWNCLARVDRINPDILADIKKAGCWQIQYGIESGSQDILDLINKKITLEQIEHSLMLTKKAGIRTKGFFIIGHFLETRETIRKTIDLAKRIAIDDFQLTLFTPFPGSDAYNDADKYGTFEKDWERMSVYDPIFVPHGLTKEDLLRSQKEAYREFYIRPKIVYSLLTKTRGISAANTLFSGAINVLQRLLT